MKTKWILFIFLVIIYPIILIGYVGYKNYEKVIGDYFIENVQKDVSTVTEQVEDNLTNLEDFMGKLQYDETIYSFTQEKEYSSRAKSNGQGTLYASMPEYEFKRSIERYLQSILLTRTELTLGSIQFTIDPSITYVVGKKNSYLEQIAFPEQKLYEYARNQEGKTLYYIDENKDTYIIQKIISRRTFGESATIAFKIDSKFLFGKFEHMLEGAKQGVYVISACNKEMLEVGEVPPIYKEKIKSYANQNMPSERYPGENPKKEFIVYDTVATDNHRMGVAVLIFTDILLQDIRKLSRNILLLCMSTIPIFLFLGYQLYKDMIYPIYVLSEKMEEIEKGTMGVLVTSEREDEIGFLFRAFNRMSNQIQYLINCVYKEQLAFKNAEIRALQAQINPHFLYNTLEVINWKARLSGADEVAQMIEALGGIMEINIDRKDERFLTLAEEIKYTDHYIFLIKKRFGDKIRFEKNMEEEALQYKVPRLILQPIIENAIEHGIEPIGKGTVTLTIAIKENLLEIEIRDDGQGMEENVASKLQYDLENWSKLNVEEMGVTSQGKIGVLNVHSRLRLIYGEEYGIRIVSAYNKGTAIKMNLPIDR